MVTINYHHDNNTSGITFFSEENKKKERSLFVLFLLAIVLSVLLRYTGSDYPFGIFKLFFYNRSISVILITIILQFYVTLRQICNSLLIVGLPISQNQLLMQQLNQEVCPKRLEFVKKVFNLQNDRCSLNAIDSV